MRKFITALLIVGIIGILSCSFLVERAHGQGTLSAEKGFKEKPSAVPGVVIVKLNDGPTSKRGGGVLEEIMADIGASALEPLFPATSASKTASSRASEALSILQHVYEIRYDTPVAPHTVAKLMAQDSRVEYAEPRYRYTLTHHAGSFEFPESPVRPRVAPNDPQFQEMSHLRHVNMPEAWDVVKASEGNVIIGIVDGGVDWRHVDLRDNVWQNSVEVINGVDDDGNGFVDDLNGWSFANGSNDPTGFGQTPTNGRHGTMVAGIASAVTDNNRGISGASWNARFMPVNAGCFSTDNAICYGFEGMVYAAREGADIVNVSWGGPDSFLGREVIRIVQELGVLVVVSAGNGGDLEEPGLNIDLSPSYPAAYDGVLVVGSTGKDSDAKALFSNFGVSVDVFAPGVNLNSTLPEDNYTVDASGTSFSAPVVAGLAALVKTRYPEWSMEQVREQIRATSLEIDGSNDLGLVGLLGKGRIDAARALTDTNVPSVRVNEVTFLDSDVDGAIQEGEAVDVTMTLRNFLASANGVSFTVSTDDPFVTFTQPSGMVGSIASEESVSGQFSFQLARFMPNDHELRFDVDITGDGFASTERIELVVNRVTHDTGVIQVSLTDQGNIGWSDFEDTSEGQGFKYFGINWLFEGGLLIGLDRETVLSSVRNEEPLAQDNDFERVPVSKFGVLPGTVTTENGLVIMNERDVSEQGGIRIHQESYADTESGNTNFVILRYILSQTNPSAPVLNNVHVGLFMDWDLTQGADFARFDPLRRTGIVQSHRDAPQLLFGTRLLTSNSGVSYRSIENEEIFDARFGGDGFTDAEKWAFLSGGIQTESVDEDDVSTLISAGPYQLAWGEPVEVAFALLAATSVENMRNFAETAQVFWNGTIRGEAPNAVSVENEEPSWTLKLDAPFPNPVSAQASIRFTVPESGSVQLALYDMLGRKIRTLLDTSVFSGVHTLEWDRKSDEGYPVSSGTYIARLTATSSGRTYTTTKSFVVLR